MFEFWADLISKNPYGFILVVAAIVLIVAAIMNAANKQAQHKSEIEKENEELKKILFRNKDYKAKGIQYYSETQRERLMRIFDEMDATGQRKLCEYAERMERDKENQGYY